MCAHFFLRFTKTRFEVNLNDSFFIYFFHDTHKKCEKSGFKWTSSLFFVLWWQTQHALIYFIVFLLRLQTTHSHVSIYTCTTTWTLVSTKWFLLESWSSKRQPPFYCTRKKKKKRKIEREKERDKKAKTNFQFMKVTLAPIT